ncbi:MAG: ATP-grasp domain-containing protein [Candidatus Methanospirareceae archaeon]
MQQLRKILAIGYSVRHIACSGNRAGYEMYAMDAFGDIDLRRCVKKFLPLEVHDNHIYFARGFEEEIKKVDGIFIGAGFELKSEAIKEREKIIGNPPEKMREVCNKEELATRLDDLGIPHPHTYTPELIKEGKIRYPVVAKPIFGGGGTSNLLCRNEKELKECLRLSGFFFQEYIRGINASVSVISTKKEAFAVSVNEQLIGLESLHAPSPFTYCGNISPFITKHHERMCEIAEMLIEEMGLVGSNGVDFVVTEDEPFVIEVNPRFQGSLDTVELSTGLNLVDAHVRAFKNSFSFDIDERKIRCFAAKAILFAKEDVVVIEDLDREGIVDIPEKGRIISKGKPVATGIGVGGSREEALSEAIRRVGVIKRGIRRYR